MYTCTHNAHMCTHMYTHMHTQEYIYTHTQIYTHRLTCAHMCMYTCTHMHAHVNTYTYACRHTQLEIKMTLAFVSLSVSTKVIHVHSGHLIDFRLKSFFQLIG